MVKVDLITGFLGSGKTTFIKKYARYLMEQLQKTFQNKTDRNGNVWLRQSSDRTVRNLRCR